MANFGQLVEKLLEGFAQGQVHNRNVAERGGDYRLKDQEAAFGKLQGLTRLTNNEEDRGFVREDRGRADRQRLAAAKAIKMAMPELEALDDDSAIEVYKQKIEQKKFEDEQKKREAEIGALEAKAAEDTRDAAAPYKFELSPEIQEAEAQARIKAHNRGPAGPQPKSPEEIAYLLAQTRNANASADQKSSLASLLGGQPGAGTLPAGGGVMAQPAPGGGTPCPPEKEGKMANGGALVCRGGQLIPNK